ncbi:matrix protein [Myotis bat morbillivirus]|uniref:Matrix protein n=1 Tax=Myotis bat morbillivirus TaxID=2853286 RepID=A0A8K1LXA3_9MONO|nr:M protein [Cloning vector pEMC-MBaMV-eGFP]UBB97710.1 matrix protein [Myotis bat morbillivirus]
MTAVYDFDPSSWDSKGALVPILPTTYPNGRLVPQVRVIDPGLGDRKGDCSIYLFLLGIIEDNDNPDKPVGRSLGSLPLGVGRSNARPEELLREAVTLNIVVRRTAGINEKLVFYNNTPLNLLSPWRKILTNGCVFRASQVCNSVNQIPLDVPQRFRVVYLSITRLSDDGSYRIPRGVLEFRSWNSMAFNILVTLQISNGRAHSDSPTSTIKCDQVTFMVHIGNFRRRKNQVYSADYCKIKIERMGLVFGLGGIGGTSLHIRCTGKMSKALHAQLGFKKILCYPIMEINEDLNRSLWRAECKIIKVQAVLQPSVPQDFRVYENVIINGGQKLFKILK